MPRVGHVADLMSVDALLHRMLGHARSADLAAVAWQELEKWVGAAERQVERIAAIMSVPADAPNLNESVRQAGIDAHFYFVCWENARKMFDALRAHAGVRGLRNVHRRYDRELRRYGTARNRLEHLGDERLPGQSKDADLRPPSAPNGWLLGSWSPMGTFGIGGEQWDVTRRSAKVLREFLIAAERAIRNEGRSVLDRDLEKWHDHFRRMWERNPLCLYCGEKVPTWEGATPIQRKPGDEERVAHPWCWDRVAMEERNRARQ